MNDLTFVGTTRARPSKRSKQSNNQQANKEDYQIRKSAFTLLASSRRMSILPVRTN